MNLYKQFSIGKMILKNKFENRFSKPDFQFSINIPNAKSSEVHNIWTVDELCIRRFAIHGFA